MMRANPGTITGSVATVSTYPAYMYKKQAGYANLVTQISRLASPATEYNANAGYNELYPRNVAFHLGIRY